MGMPRRDINYFVDQATTSLSLFITPGWAKTTDRKLAIFRYWSNLEYKMIGGNTSSKSISVGDKFKVIVRFAPAVNLDKNIFVEFGKSTPRVIGEYEGRQFAITGLPAWLKIQSAKMGIKPEDRLVLGITTSFECIKLYPFNIYKVIEQPTCKHFRF